MGRHLSRDELLDIERTAAARLKERTSQPEHHPDMLEIRHICDVHLVNWVMRAGRPAKTPSTGHK